MGTATYALALGSNRRSRFGSPARTIAAAVRAIGGARAVSPVLRTAAMGPSTRTYANAVVAAGGGPPEPAVAPTTVLMPLNDWSQADTALDDPEPITVELPQSAKGESIILLEDGDLLVGSEGRPSEVVKVPVPETPDQ